MHIAQVYWSRILKKYSTSSCPSSGRSVQWIEFWAFVRPNNARSDRGRRCRAISCQQNNMSHWNKPNSLQPATQVSSIPSSAPDNACKSINSSTYLQHILVPLTKIWSSSVMANTQMWSFFFCALRHSGAVDVDSSADDTPLVTWRHGFATSRWLNVDQSHAARFWRSSCDRDHQNRKVPNGSKNRTKWMGSSTHL